jgi:hypothetical protein
MKKLILIAAVAFTACKGGSSSEASKCDTACVKADTIIKPIVDTIKNVK